MINQTRMGLRDEDGTSKSVFLYCGVLERLSEANFTPVSAYGVFLPHINLDLEVQFRGTLGTAYKRVTTIILPFYALESLVYIFYTVV